MWRPADKLPPPKDKEIVGRDINGNQMRMRWRDGAWRPAHNVSGAELGAIFDGMRLEIKEWALPEEVPAKAP